MKSRRDFFRGKRVVVTGAASGIGEATVIELTRRGARAVLLDKDGAGLSRVALAVVELGGTAETHVLDLADAAAVAAVAEEVLAGGPVDVLVNNAGVAVVAPFERTSERDWEWIMGVNVHGPLRLTRALLPAMKAQGSAHVVVVASLAGLVGAPGMVAYSTTKFAMVGFAEALRLELASDGIDVTTVCPGYVRTNLHRATRYDNPGFRRLLDEAPAIYGMTREHVARALCNAVEKRRPLVVLGPEKIGFWLKRVAPSAAFAVSRLVARASGIASRDRDRVDQVECGVGEAGARVVAAR
jgi:short-subunit dehydrogenase